MTTTDPGRWAWLDVSSGVAGDMLLGALVDAGAPVEMIQGAVDQVIPGTVRLVAGEVHRAGMRATKVDVVVLREDLPGRRWTDVRGMLEEADLSDSVRSQALAVFGRLADAEARAHGTHVEDVHFHEVGAWDSIADIVGVCAAVETLGIARISAGPMALGSGTARTAHGEIPVPVPAVLELAEGWTVRSGGAGELATPTGTALVTTLAQTCEDLPHLTIQRVGVGAGTRDPSDRPNVVRVVMGSAATSEADLTAGTHAEVVLEANVDDLDPRVWPSVLAALLTAGASDAWLTPILMKKGRPAHMLSVLAPLDLVQNLRDQVFALVPTLGVRESLVGKTALARTWRTVEVAEGEVRIKLGLRGTTIVTATPEYDDVALAATRAARPVRVVMASAVAAAAEAGLAAGQPVPETGRQPD